MRAFCVRLKHCYLLALATGILKSLCCLLNEGCLLQGVGREIRASHIYQNVRVPEESSTKYGRDSMRIPVGLKIFMNGIT